MKNCLVTGADGFIGSHLVESLVSENYKVTAFCQYNSFGHWGWLDQLPIETKKNIEVILGDIRDQDSVNSAMKNIDTVFNLAALIAIPYSYNSPKSYVETNINGTLNVLTAARDLEVNRIVHTSTSETYGTAQYVPINEEHPLVGQSPYAASKIGADQIAISFWHSFKCPLTILRPFNTYGPRQSTRAVIPTIISQIASGEKFIKLGSLKPTRDFNFVFDTCDAFKAVATSDKTLGEVINSASNFEISIGDTALMIAEIMNQKISIAEDKSRIRPKDSEVNRLFGDNSKLKRLTTWSPSFNGFEGFKKGLKITAEWFSNPANRNLYNGKFYSL